MDGSPGVVTQSGFETFRSSFAGDLLLPAAPAYDEARRIHNGMIDRRPALIARCTGTPDVAAAVRFCRDNELLLSVRCGGHSVAGFSVCEGGVMIDLTPMNRVDVNPSARTATAGGGAQWSHFDAATLAHGLAVTGGIAPTTGVGGYTLGGGHGYLMRKHGLACDNLLSAEVVTADAPVLTASPNENADLFWGLRGGGGNFGIVTSFEFQVYPLGQVLGGLLIYPLDAAKQVLRIYRDIAAGAPDEFGSAFALATHPEAGQIVGIIVCHSGAMEDGERLLQPLRDFKPIIVDQVAPCSYALVQEISVPFNPPGKRNYWKSNSLRDLSDDLIDLAVDCYRSVPAPHTHVVFEHFGGAVARVPDDATACHSRDWPFDFLLVGMWERPEDDERVIEWVRGLFDEFQAFTADGAYTNYMDADKKTAEGRLRAAYGDQTYNRLRELKARYDPSNLFRLNQNIEP